MSPLIEAANAFKISAACCDAYDWQGALLWVEYVLDICQREVVPMRLVEETKRLHTYVLAKSKFVPDLPLYGVPKWVPKCMPR